MKLAIHLSAVRAVIFTPALLIGLWACPSSSTSPTPTIPPPSPTASNPPTDTKCSDACVNLVRLGCTQGLPASCSIDLQAMEDAQGGLITVPDSGGRKLTCLDLALAASPEAVISLGGTCTKIP